jgi:TolA-binding protein
LDKGNFHLSAVVLAMLFVGAARADTLWVSSGGGAIQIQNAKVTRIENGTIFFSTSSGDSSRELGKVQRMLLDNEPAFNAAEEAAAAGKWDAAADGYQKTIAATARPWLKNYAAQKLLTAADKSGRFEAAASAYVALTASDPTASATRPSVPAQQSSALDAAVTDVNASLQKQLTDAQQIALLGFLVELQKARHDSAGEKQAAEKLDAVLARDPSNPAAGSILVRRALESAQQAVAGKNYDAGIEAIESNRQRFVDPAQQADALFLLAQARFGKAQASKDKTALEDAGLAYMRVVANCKDVAGQPHVVESLMQTAAIHELLNEPQVAAQIYQQIVSQYPDAPAAAGARDRAAQLTGKK